MAPIINIKANLSLSYEPPIIIFLCVSTFADRCASIGTNSLLEIKNSNIF